MSVKTRQNVDRLTAVRRLEELRGFVVLCFGMLEDYDLKEISNLTRLSITTVWRLRQGDVSLATHFGTVQSLGIAAGLRLVMTEYRVSVRVVA